MPAKQQGSAPRAVDWPVRLPATFTRCDLSLSKTPKGAILPQNHSESGECRSKRLPKGLLALALPITGAPVAKLDAKTEHVYRGEPRVY
jgi:hypothetical protein